MPEKLPESNILHKLPDVDQSKKELDEKWNENLNKNVSIEENTP
jgi:hypothetical protein